MGKDEDKDGVEPLDQHVEDDEDNNKDEDEDEAKPED